LGLGTDAAASHSERIREGTFGVGWMAAVMMQVLQTVGRLEVYIGPELAFLKVDVYI
jgi:hypothetical protein